MKPAGPNTDKWQLSDQAIIQATTNSNQNRGGQKVTLHRSTKILPSKEGRNRTREYYGEFDADMNWTALLSISTVQSLGRQKQIPDSIVLGSHFL